MNRAFGDCRHSARRCVISNLKLYTYCIQVVSTMVEHKTETPAIDVVIWVGRFANHPGGRAQIYTSTTQPALSPLRLASRYKISHCHGRLAGPWHTCMRRTKHQFAKHTSQCHTWQIRITVKQDNSLIYRTCVNSKVNGIRQPHSPRIRRLGPS
ncbi:hypothetical protein P692DRAFT_20120482 [Suillus brevipes Sb2]|nr:hypothetical protein P692DRAFT_20120482 [Suillus brevipes Sb2]